MQRTTKMPDRSYVPNGYDPTPVVLPECTKETQISATASAKKNRKKKFKYKDGMFNPKDNKNIFGRY